MRVEFVRAVTPLVERDPRSIFITGDLGYNALEGLAASLGKRFLNAGVAEQNMVGVAAGLALSGLTPWVYSIAPFATFRCLEHIRNDVCLHGLPVRIVGNGGGYTYGIMGSTHHALEDLAVLKALPGLRLFFPGTGDQVAAAVAKMGALPGPAYLRLSISGYPKQSACLSENPTTLTRRYLAGGEFTVIGVGHAVQIALSTPGLAQAGANLFGVARFPLDPVEDSELFDSIALTRRVLVIEEHYRPGGIGESIAASLPESCSFELLSAQYSPDQRYGSSRFHLEQSGLTPETLMQAARRLARPRSR